VSLGTSIDRWELYFDMAGKNLTVSVEPNTSREIALQPRVFHHNPPAVVPTL